MAIFLFWYTYIIVPFVIIKKKKNDASNTGDHEFPQIPRLLVNFHAFLEKIIKCFKHYILYGFEFKVVLFLDWLPQKVGEPCLPSYLTRDEFIPLSKGHLCKRAHSRLGWKLNSAFLIFLSVLISITVSMPPCDIIIKFYWS